MNSNTKTRLCTVVGCGEKHVSQGYCRTHYYRFKRYGNPLEVRQIQSKNGDGSCRVKECSRKHYAKGYCKYHHHRWETYGDPLYVRPTVCKIEGCSKKITGYGMCQMHYLRWKKHGDPHKVLKMVNAPCKIKGCKNKNRRNGYCEEHYLKSELFRNRHRMYSAKRRSLKLNAPINDFEKNEWEEVLSNFNYECAYCGSSENLEQDHVIPLSKGGSHTAENIISACKNCNSSKRQNLLEKWYPKQPFYDTKREEKIYKWMNYKIHDNKIQMQLF